MSATQGWIYLIVSGLIDVAWAVSMKKANGFSNPGWSAVSLLAPRGLRVSADEGALQVLPVGAAYAAWTGIGAAGAVIAGIFVFSEPANPIRLFCIAVVVAGVIGLRTTT